MYATLLQQEQYWSRRVKQLWPAHGDSNSKYFHLMASHRRKKNLVNRLKNSNGQWIDWQNGLPEVIINYFTALFTSASGDVSPIISCVDRVVTTEHNDLLLAPFTSDEIKAALFSMHPDKSDGFNPGFFQVHWDVIHDDSVTACLDFLNADGPLPGGNVTSPEEVFDLRPVSLCNVVDRVVYSCIIISFPIAINTMNTKTQYFTTLRCICERQNKKLLYSIFVFITISRLVYPTSIYLKCVWLLSEKTTNI